MTTLKMVGTTPTSTVCVVSMMSNWNLDFFPVFAYIDAYVVYIYIYIRWKVQFLQGFA